MMACGAARGRPGAVRPVGVGAAGERGGDGGPVEGAGGDAEPGQGAHGVVGVAAGGVLAASPRRRGRR